MRRGRLAAVLHLVPHYASFGHVTEVREVLVLASVLRGRLSTVPLVSSSLIRVLIAVDTNVGVAARPCDSESLPLGLLVILGKPILRIVLGLLLLGLY